MPNHFSHASLPYPVRGARYTLVIPYLASDGTPTDPTGSDIEIWKDAGGFADCSQQPTVMAAGTGLTYLTLTAAEMDCAMLALNAKVASGPKPTLAALSPRTLPVLRSGTAQAGAASTLTLDAGAVAIDDYYNGCILLDGAPGALGTEARVITDYDGTTKIATVSPAWEVTPTGTPAFSVLITEFCQFRSSDLQSWRGAAPNALIAGRIESQTGAMSNGVLTPNAIAADAITAAKLAPDVTTELQAGLSTLDAAGVRAAVGLASPNLDTQLDVLPTTLELNTALDALPTTTEIDTELTASHGSGSWAAGVGGGGGPTAGEIAAAVLSAAVTAPVAPPVAPYTVDDVLGWILAICKFPRTQSKTEEKVYASGGATLIGISAKSDVSDIFERGEYVAP